jgi:hypothetical protein
MLHHVEPKIFFGVLHMFEFETLFEFGFENPIEKEMEKELENTEKRKGESSSSGPVKASQVARPRACRP